MVVVLSTSLPCCPVGWSDWCRGVCYCCSCRRSFVSNSGSTRLPSSSVVVASITSGGPIMGRMVPSPMLPRYHRGPSSHCPAPHLGSSGCYGAWVAQGCHPRSPPLLRSCLAGPSCSNGTVGAGNTVYLLGYAGGQACGYLVDAGVNQFATLAFGNTSLRVDDTGEY